MSEPSQKDENASITPSEVMAEEPSVETEAVEQVSASILKPQQGPDSSSSLNQQDDSGTAEDPISEVLHLEHNDEEGKEKKEDLEREKANEEEIQSQDQDQVVPTQPTPESNPQAGEGNQIDQPIVETSSTKTEELKKELKEQAESAPAAKPPGAQPELELSSTTSEVTHSDPVDKEAKSTAEGLEEQVERMDLAGETQERNEEGSSQRVVEEDQSTSGSSKQGEESRKEELEHSEKEPDDSLAEQSKEVATLDSPSSALPTAISTSTDNPDQSSPESPSTPKGTSSQLSEPQSTVVQALSDKADDSNPELQNAKEERTLPPPPIPSKDQSIDPKLIQNDPTSSHPQPVRISMPKGVGADPSDVAAVAAAFGRNSPRVSTPSNSNQESSKALPLPPDSSKQTSLEAPKTPNSGGGIKVGKGPPPASPPPEEVQFDFNKFLEQMRHKSAQPVGEYVKSFIKGFSKKPYRTSDQSKLIFDFLAFISTEMRKCSVWAKASEAEFSNAEEAMEKLVMNRLYAYTFAPAVKKEGKWPVQTDDLERDRVLSQRSEMFNWVREEHLEVPTGDHSKGFIEFAMQELVKINNYKAPRDKLICILNSCKVIFGLIRHLSSQESADTFIPVLIFIVLQANPDHLISNVEYISRFRTPERLSSESAYYLSSLVGAIAFIETMDYTSLSNITQEEFEKNVGEAVQRIGSQPRSSSPPQRSALPQSHASNSSDPAAQAGVGEESASALAGASFADDTKAFLQRTGEAARIGFTSSLGKPMGALGKFLNEGLDGIRTPGGTNVQGQSSGAGSPLRNDSPTPASNRNNPQNSSNTGSMRGKFLGGLFGDGGGTGENDDNSSSARGFNAASWSRSMRADPGAEEPQTPLSSEELKQGRFGVLPPAPPRASRHPAGFTGADSSNPRPPIPQRTESIDSYVDEDEDDEDRIRRSGVRTPSDSGSEGGRGGGGGGGMSTTSSRSRLPDFNSFVPSFLSETPNRPTQPHSGIEQPLRRGPVAAAQRQDQYHSSSPQRFDSSSSFVQSSSFGPHLQEGVRAQSPDESQIANLSAEVDRAHEMQMGAGIETLKSIFPGTEKDVCQMVLENCNGDVQAAIDQLLEMS